MNGGQVTLRGEDIFAPMVNGEHEEAANLAAIPVGCPQSAGEGLKVRGRSHLVKSLCTASECAESNEEVDPRK